MRKLLIGIAAAATLLTAAPAMAQIGFYAGDRGVGVQVGPDHWDRGYHRGWYRDYGWYRGGCRTITVRERLPNGAVVVRTRERC